MFIRRIIVIAIVLGAAEIILPAQPAPAVGTFAALPTARSLAQLSPPRAALRLTATLSGHAKDIVEIAFSPDGETVATGSEDGLVRLWNTRTGERLATLSHAGRYEALKIVWSPDGRSIAVDGLSRHGVGDTQIWDVRNGKVLTSLPAHYYILVWSPNGRFLLSTNLERLASIWDAKSGALVATLEQDPPCPKRSFLKSLGETDSCNNLTGATGSFLADGRTILTTSWNHSAKLWDSETGKLKATLDLANVARGVPYRGTVMLSPDRRSIATYVRQEVILLDSQTGEVKSTLESIGAPLAFSPNGQTLLTVVTEPKAKLRDEVELRLYDTVTAEVRTAFERIPAVTGCYWSPDGKVIVTVGSARTETRMLDTSTGRVKARLPYRGCTSDTLFGNGGCEPFIFSADGRITLKEKDPLRLWSTESGELLTTLDAASTPAVFSPTNPRVLVTRGKDKRTALIWEVSWQ